tara:strand:+ start:2450 stop:2641 length:192 start_codon:yes stop_codon:yes gene_type:complete
MDILRLFLMNEGDRLKSNKDDGSNKEYLLWRKELEEQKNYERKERVRSVSYKQKSQEGYRPIA